jgi:hypothetical protein
VLFLPLARNNFWKNSGSTSVDPPSSYLFASSDECNANDIPFIYDPITGCLLENPCSQCNTGGPTFPLPEPENQIKSIILTDYIDKYKDFMAEDNEDTRDAFVNLASLQLTKDDTEYSAINEEWEMEDVYENNFLIDHETAHWIMVAKTIYEEAEERSSRKPENLFAGLSSADKQKLKDKRNGILVYPNPVKNTLQIEHNYTSAIQLQFSNLQGKVLHTNTYTNQTISIDMSAYPSGMYFLQLINEAGNSSVRQIIVE